MPAFWQSREMEMLSKSCVSNKSKKVAQMWASVSWNFLLFFVFIYNPLILNLINPLSRKEIAINLWWHHSTDFAKMALNFGKCAKFFVVMQGENQRQPKGNKGRKRLRPHDTMESVKGIQKVKCRDKDHALPQKRYKKQHRMASRLIAKRWYKVGRDR